MRLIWQVECQLSLARAPPSARGWPLAALVSQLGELPRPGQRGRCVDDVTRSCHRGGRFVSQVGLNTVDQRRHSGAEPPPGRRPPRCSAVQTAFRTASSAASDMALSTKPKPRDWPVSRSVTIATLSTPGTWLKSWPSASVEVLKERRSRRRRRSWRVPLRGGARPGDRRPHDHQQAGGRQGSDDRPRGVELRAAHAELR
jgi:hypothetical protein